MLIASKAADAVKVSIVGEITGETMWSYSDAAVLTALLGEAGGEKIELWVSSSGGSLDAAMTMRAQLEAYQGPIEIHTAGIVASAATLFLCIPGAKITAHRGSIFMFHQAKMTTQGNAAELRKDADVLDICDDEIVRVYALRAKCDDRRIRDLMAEEYWFRPEELRELGFIDDIAEPGSDGYIAEPRNPEPVGEEISTAVSARLAPRIEALQTGLATITAGGEKRVQAITDAAGSAVSGITSAVSDNVAKITASAGELVATLQGELKAVLDEVEMCKNAYDKQVLAYKRLDEALSRVYALNAGEPGIPLHDEQLRDKSGGFKLNI